MNNNYFQTRFKTHYQLIMQLKMASADVGFRVKTKIPKRQTSICTSYTMGRPSVRGDNPRALASGLSYVQVGNNGIAVLYHPLHIMSYFVLKLVRVVKSGKALKLLHQVSVTENKTCTNHNVWIFLTQLHSRANLSLRKQRSVTLLQRSLSQQR